jgi:hypothetical protein
MKMFHFKLGCRFPVKSLHLAKVVTPYFSLIQKPCSFPHLAAYSPLPSAVGTRSRPPSSYDTTTTSDISRQDFWLLPPTPTTTGINKMPAIYLFNSRNKMRAHPRLLLLEQDNCCYCCHSRNKMPAIYPGIVGTRCRAIHRCHSRNKMPAIHTWYSRTMSWRPPLSW